MKGVHDCFCERPQHETHSEPPRTLRVTTAHAIRRDRREVCTLTTGNPIPRDLRYRSWGGSTALPLHPPPGCSVQPHTCSIRVRSPPRPREPLPEGHKFAPPPAFRPYSTVTTIKGVPTCLGHKIFGRSGGGAPLMVAESCSELRCSGIIMDGVTITVWKL